MKKESTPYIGKLLFVSFIAVTLLLAATPVSGNIQKILENSGMRKPHA